MKRTTFASLSYAAKNKRTKRERSLAEMEAVVPWAELEAVIEPCYPRRASVGATQAVGGTGSIFLQQLQRYRSRSDVYIYKVQVGRPSG